MRLGIFAKTFPGTSPQIVLPQARAAGFTAVQYNLTCSGLAAMPDAVSPEIADSVACAAAVNGVAVAAVSGTYNMIHPDPDARTAGLRRLEVIAGAAAAMGTHLITLCTGTCDPDDQWRYHPENGGAEAWRMLLGEMRKAVDIAERHGIMLGIEPELANVVNSAFRARKLIDTVGSPILKIVLDPANLFERVPLAEQRDIVSGAIDLLADRIIMGHAKDRSVEGAFVPAGHGVLDYRHFLSRLRAAGFDGDLVTHGLRPEVAPVVAAFLGGLLA